jgi:hypothetical protein
MPLIAKGSSSNFTPAPAGQWQAVCVDVVDRGWHEKTFNGQAVLGKDGKPAQVHKVQLMWEINEEMADGRPYIVSAWFNLSLHEKATLRKSLESWLGRTLTEPEVTEGYDLETLLGKNCQLTVVHKVTPNGTYANVTAIVPLMKGMKNIKPSADYVRFCDRPAVADTNGDNGADEDEPLRAADGTELQF